MAYLVLCCFICRNDLYYSFLYDILETTYSTVNSVHGTLYLASNTKLIRTHHLNNPG